MDKGALNLPIPHELLFRIEKIEDSLRRMDITPNERIAVFDLDNTLLFGDIGEAIFAQLKIDEQEAFQLTNRERIPLSWTEYHRLLYSGRKADVYKKIVSCMAFLPLETLLKATEKVLLSKAKFLDLEGASIPIPSPNPVMRALISYLQSIDYKVYVISSSNHFSVQLAAKKFFNISGSNSFGIKNKIQEIKLGDVSIKILNSEFEEPIPIEAGKVRVYKKFIGSISPLITAGDSLLDIPMLNLTNRNGIIIWVGKDDEQYQVVSQNIVNSKNLYFCDIREINNW